MSNPYIKPPLPVQIGPYAGTLRIHRDERGVAWIDESNIKVIEVALDHVQGQTPEQIHEQHSHLSLAQIYAAIAYYYDYQPEIDDLMREWREAYEEGYARPESVAWREKMRERAAAMRATDKEETAELDRLHEPIKGPLKRRFAFGAKSTSENDSADSV